MLKLRRRGSHDCNQLGEKVNKKIIKSESQNDLGWTGLLRHVQSHEAVLDLDLLFSYMWGMLTHPLSRCSGMWETWETWLIVKVEVKNSLSTSAFSMPNADTSPFSFIRWCHELATWRRVLVPGRFLHCCDDHDCDVCVSLSLLFQASLLYSPFQSLVITQLTFNKAEVTYPSPTRGDTLSLVCLFWPIYR